MIRIERPVYEDLIRQIVYTEENIDGIAQKAQGVKVFPTHKRARWYFEEYIKEVESLFKEAEVVATGVGGDISLNTLPFIVLGSCFTLTDRRKRARLCRMTYDEMQGESGACNVYFLSRAGRALLMKEDGRNVVADMGKGPAEFTIGSIKIG